ncbi:MAG TPA: radical SAM protein [Chloroflexota bacterium]|nr:radical SAM protein [Chloroflexota bacterium]
MTAPVRPRSADLRLPPLPTFVQLEPVGQCNLRCAMCPIQFREDGPPYGPPAFMEWRIFEAILDQLPGLEELHLQGLGEPMMHPRFFDMVRFATARGVRVSTNSNCTLLTPRRAEECVRSGLDWLHASVDGATRDTYERIRVRAQFDRLLDNIGSLRSAKARLESDLPHMRLVMVLMRENLHELPEIVRLAHAFAFEAVFVQHLCHDFGESSLPDRYRPMREFVQRQTLLGSDEEQVHRVFAEARDVADQLGVELRLPNLRPRPHAPGVPGPDRCAWPWSGAYVSYQGIAMPCCMVATPDRANLGNMGNGGVAAIWWGPEYARFRQQLASDRPPGVCEACSVYSGTF